MDENKSAKTAHQILDCIGLYCPMPILKTREEMDKLTVDEILEVLADDPAAEEDIKAWAKRAGQKLLKIEKNNEDMSFLIQKIK